MELEDFSHYAKVIMIKSDKETLPQTEHTDYPADATENWPEDVFNGEHFPSCSLLIAGPDELKFRIWDGTHTIDDEIDEDSSIIPSLWS